MKYSLSCKYLLLILHHASCQRLELGRSAYHRSVQCTMVIDFSAALRCMCLLGHVTCLPVGICLGAHKCSPRKLPEWQARQGFSHATPGRRLLCSMRLGLKQICFAGPKSDGQRCPLPSSNARGVARAEKGIRPAQPVLEPEQEACSHHRQ